jgi:cellulose biosynthesis protein BcsQ
MKRLIFKEAAQPIVDTPNELGQLRQEARVALDLAVVALAPSQLVERLAAAVGLLESLGDLPSGSPPVVAMVPDTMARARRSLNDWRAWHKQHLANRIPLG